MEKRNGLGAIVGFALLLVIVVVVVFSTLHFAIIQPDEVGIIFRQGRMEELIDGSSGQDSNLIIEWGLFVEIKKIQVRALPFDSTDPEIITNDSQRVGLQVSGDIVRTNDLVVIREKWGTYSLYFESDTQLLNKIDTFTKQAMKSCIGERSFNEAVIGEGRNALVQCIDESTNAQAAELGVVVRNVTIPNVIISSAVQEKLDEIVAARLDSEKARQQVITAQAQAEANAAIAAGEVEADYARDLEEAKQQASVAGEQVTTLQAKLEQTRQELENARLELELVEIEADIAFFEAQVSIAQELALANLIGQNPAYTDLLIARANAEALSNVDNIFLTDGIIPNMILSGDTVLPTFNTAP